MTNISAERKAELQSLGFSVEDMCAEWGPEWHGQYRFLRDEQDDVGIPQFSEQEAWNDCSQYEYQLRTYYYD